MYKILELIGWPALRIFNRFGEQAFGPVSMGGILLVLLAGQFAPSEIRTPAVVLACLCSTYFGMGFLYHRYRHIKIGRDLLGRALAGDWKFDARDVDADWRDQGVVPMVLSYTERVKTLTDETARIAEDLLRNSKTTAQDANRLLSQAEEIAAMLEETAAGLEQFTSSIDRNAQHCSEVRDLARKSTEAAYAGADQVIAISRSVNETGRKSGQVIGLINLIDSFAAQTNMLALNATIEAARVGKDGRGFTQVADEVRELSNRSSEVANLIRERITAASDRLQAGVNVSDESTRIIEDVLIQVAQAQELIDDIANASSEQSSGVGQIKQAVEQMAGLTQENASAVEQVARLAGSLERESFALDKSLEGLKASRFNSTEACVSLVRLAVSEIQRNGPSVAARKFNQRNGGFHQRDLFIVMSDMRGFLLAHGGEAALIGTDTYELTDAKGYAYVKQAVQLATNPGSGWLSYEVRNPATGRPSIKNTYVERVPGTDYWVCCGIFSAIRHNQAMPA